jgi:Fur family ferric uptake transcriptional regulator
MIDLPGCLAPARRLLPAGFQVDGHELTLFGLCADCASPKIRRHRQKRIRS